MIKDQYERFDECRFTNRLIKSKKEGKPTKQDIEDEINRVLKKHGISITDDVREETIDYIESFWSDEITPANVQEAVSEWYNDTKKHFPDMFAYGKKKRVASALYLKSIRKSIRSSKRIRSSRQINSGYFSYCFNDADGYTLEFDTLAEAKRAAKQYTKENPDCEVNLYGMSSYYYKNGREEKDEDEIYSSTYKVFPTENEDTYQYYPFNNDIEAEEFCKQNGYTHYERVNDRSFEDDFDNIIREF